MGFVHISILTTSTLICSSSLSNGFASNECTVQFGLTFTTLEIGDDANNDDSSAFETVIRIAKIAKIAIRDNPEQVHIVKFAIDLS